VNGHVQSAKVLWSLFLIRQISWICAHHPKQMIHLGSFVATAATKRQ